MERGTEERETMRYGVRPMLPEDVPQVSAIEREAFPEVWPPTPFQKEMRNHLARHLVAWDTEASEAREAEEAAEESKPSEPPRAGWRGLPLLGRFLPRVEAPPPQTDGTVGYVALWFMVDEAHITSIAVRGSHRGQGVGEILVIASVEMAQLRGSRIVTLETRVSNIVAQNLYKKYGFSTVGRRKRYYTDNNEDAFVMSTGDISSPEYRASFDDLRRRHSERWGASSRYIV